MAAKNASSSVVGRVAALQVVGRLEREQLAAVEDPDPVGERLGLVQVVRAEQDRGVVRAADLADEVLHLELRARVEARRRLVQEQDSTGEVSSARASATFCCMPRERFSIDSPRRSDGKPTRPRISGMRSRVWPAVMP